MKIAVTYENGNVFQHFGHTQQFKVYKVRDGKVAESQIVNTEGKLFRPSAPAAVSNTNNYFTNLFLRPNKMAAIPTGSDKNAWTAEGFDPAKAVITGIPSQLDSKLVQGHGSFKY